MAYGMSWSCKVARPLAFSGAALLAASLGPRAPAQEFGKAADLAALESELHDCCSRGDAAGAEALRAALEACRDEDPARVHLLLALTHVAPAMLTNGSPDRRDVEGTGAHVEAAVAELEAALAEDPAFGRAYGAAILCLWWQLQLGPEDPAALGARYGELLKAGEQHADPFLRLLQIQSRQFGRAEVDLDALGEETLALLDEVGGAVEMHGDVPDFLDLLTFGMAARAFLFQPVPRPDLAAEVTAELLALAPDMKMARDFLVPFVAVRTPLSADAYADLEWTALAEDAAGDGALPGLADAVALETAADAEFLWLRILLAAAPPEQAFGMNVVFAAADPGDATSWWGGNTELRFDRLATVWLARDPEGRYRGAVGLAPHGPAFAGEMSAQSDGTVGHAVDPDANAFVLRIPWAELGGEGPVRFGVAVGSNAQWNDDVPDRGTVEVERPE